jgi:hypothetical protein
MDAVQVRVLGGGAGAGWVGGFAVVLGTALVVVRLGATVVMAAAAVGAAVVVAAVVVVVVVGGGGATEVVGSSVVGSAAAAVSRTGAGVPIDPPAPISTNDATRIPVATLRLEIRSQASSPRANATSATPNATTPRRIRKTDTRTTFPRLRTEPIAAWSTTAAARCVTRPSIEWQCR